MTVNLQNNNKKSEGNKAVSQEKMYEFCEIPTITIPGRSSFIYDVRRIELQITADGTFCKYHRNTLLRSWVLRLICMFWKSKKDKLISELVLSIRAEEARIFDMMFPEPGSDSGLLNG